MSNKPDEIQTKLESQGWRQYPNQFKKDAEMWCKRFPATRCLCNDDRDGIQVEIYIYPGMDGIHGEDANFEVELTGEIATGWFHVHRYGMKTGGIVGLNEAIALVPSMLAQWELAATQPPPTGE
jgi:hypothetical protein